MPMQSATSSARCHVVPLLLLVLPLAAAARPPSLPSLVHHWLHWGANHHRPDQARAAFHPRASPHPRHALPSYVTGAATRNHTLPFYALTMMHRPEIDLLASYLAPHHVYLEFGAGGSTLAFPPLVNVSYSVEHNCEWAQHITHVVSQLPHRAPYANLHVKCVPVKQRQNGWGTLSNYEHANYKQFRQYVDAVDTIPELTIDRVFIDGRARLACALKILPRLHNDSLIFIHDFFARTSHYEPVLRYYTEVARVLARQNTDPTQGPVDEPQGLVVLRRKPATQYNLSTEDIDAIYESIDWRFPFLPPLTSLPAYVRYYLTVATDPGLWARARNTDDVLRLVRRDVFTLSLVYIVVTLILGNAHLFRRSRGPNARRKRAASRDQPV